MGTGTGTGTGAGMAVNKGVRGSDALVDPNTVLNAASAAECEEVFFLATWLKPTEDEGGTGIDAPKKGGGADWRGL